MGAAVRTMQMAGALEAILELAVAYANERVAFERPIAKFQAVQHNLARLAGEVAVAIAAAGSAADAIAEHQRSGVPPPLTPPRVVSKTRLRHDGEGNTSARGAWVFLQSATRARRGGPFRRGWACAGP